MAEDIDVARVAAALRAPPIRYQTFGNGPVRPATGGSATDARASAAAAAADLSALHATLSEPVNSAHDLAARPVEHAAPPQFTMDPQLHPQVAFSAFSARQPSQAPVSFEPARHDALAALLQRPNSHAAPQPAAFLPAEPVPAWAMPQSAAQSGPGQPVMGSFAGAVAQSSPQFQHTHPDQQLVQQPWGYAPTAPQPVPAQPSFAPPAFAPPAFGATPFAAPQPFQGQSSYASAPPAPTAANMPFPAWMTESGEAMAPTQHARGQDGMTQQGHDQQNWAGYGQSRPSGPLGGAASLLARLQNGAPAGGSGPPAILLASLGAAQPAPASLLSGLARPVPQWGAPPPPFAYAPSHQPADLSGWASQPAQFQPAPFQPAQFQPAPFQPAPFQPIPFQPAPVQVPMARPATASLSDVFRLVAAPPAATPRHAGFDVLRGLRLTGRA